MNTKEIGTQIFNRAEAMKKSISLFDTTNRIAEIELQLNEKNRRKTDGKR
jgi:hypothetical protein